MQKRAFGDSVMVYILAVVILGAIALVGWKMVSSSTSKFCDTELTEFQLLLGEQSRGLRNGETVEKTMEVPCGAEKVYVFDAETKPSPDFFEDPLLKDAVASNAAKNVYVIKGGKTLTSFEVPFLEIPYPYFTCMMPSSGKIDFALNGLGRGVGVEPSCEQKNCVVVPVEILGKNPLSNQLSIEREYRQCDGTLTMEIRITPKVPVSFTYTESIPGCADYPEEQYANVKGFSPLGFGSRTLVYDGTAGIIEPITLSYDITIPFSDRCIQDIKGALS